MSVTTGRRVLVIDDEPELVDLIKLILTRSRNDQGIAAYDGQDGLMKAEQDPPDLIILDLMMPGLNGYEVYERLKAIPALQHIPVLFLSDGPRSVFYPRVQHLGAAGCLCEPYGPQDLIAARDAALRGETYYPPLPEKTH
jgi:DNA-binding response OmpR family regulator